MAKKKAPAASSETKPPKGESAKFWLAELTASEKRERTWRKCGNGLKSAGQYAMMTLHKIDTNEWILGGVIST